MCEINLHTDLGTRHSDFWRRTFWRLKRLSLLNTKVVGSGLGDLKGLKNLENLAITGPAIQVDKLGTIRALTELRSLEISCRLAKIIAPPFFFHPVCCRNEPHLEGYCFSFLRICGLLRFSATLC